MEYISSGFYELQCAFMRDELSRLKDQPKQHRELATQLLFTERSYLLSKIGEEKDRLYQLDLKRDELIGLRQISKGLFLDQAAIARTMLIIHGHKEELEEKIRALLNRLVNIDVNIKTATLH